VTDRQTNKHKLGFLSVCVIKCGHSAGKCLKSKPVSKHLYQHFEELCESCDKVHMAIELDLKLDLKVICFPRTLNYSKLANGVDEFCATILASGKFLLRSNI
jgi:hypothetical protein